MKIKSSWFSYKEGATSLVNIIVTGGIQNGYIHLYVETGSKI